MTEPNNQQQGDQGGEKQGNQQQGGQNSQQQQQGQQGSQQGAGQQNQNQGPGQQGNDQRQTFDREYVENLRNEAASYRTERNNLRSEFDQLKTGLAQALGIGGQDNQDPAQLQNQLQQTQQQFRRERLQNAVLTTSLAQNADPSLTWAHLFASGALDNIDISAGDFSQQIQSQVQTALAANPKLAADFSPQNQAGNVGGGTNPPNVNQQSTDRNPWKRDTLNMTEQGRILNDNPALAKQMMEAAEVPKPQIQRMLRDHAIST